MNTADYSNHDAVTQFHFNIRYVWLLSVVAAMGGFLFGYDWVVVGGAKPFYEPYFDVTTSTQQGWGTSSALIGCIAGALLCFLRSDAWGRKPLLVFAGLVFTVSAVGTALIDTFFWYNTMRIIGGVAIGIALNLSPMYISEMAPPHLRGKLVSLNQLLIMFGVLAAQVVNWRIATYDTSLPGGASFALIKESWSGQFGWRWMFGAEAIPALLFFMLMLAMPESARWLMKNGQTEKALKILTKIGGAAYAKREVGNIGSTLSSDEVAQVHFSDLMEKKLLKILGLGIFLAVFQQWCGMNVVFYYAADIFQAAGYELQQMMLNIVVIGTVMVIAVIVTILVIERLGRKKLMLIGSGLLATLYGVIGFLFFNDIKGLPIVIMTLANVAAYSLTLAPVVWVILAEIFPNRIRGAAMSVAAIALWIGNFSLTFTFPAIKESLGWAWNFWLYGIICAAGFVVLYFVLPETKGKSLEQLEAELTNAESKKPAR
jgi:sugar porter (SP) family MFS transporter